MRVKTEPLAAAPLAAAQPPPTSPEEPARDESNGCKSQSSAPRPAPPRRAAKNAVVFPRAQHAPLRRASLMLNAAATSRRLLSLKNRNRTASGLFGQSRQGLITWGELMPHASSAGFEKWIAYRLLFAKLVAALPAPELDAVQPRRFMEPAFKDGVRTQLPAFRARMIKTTWVISSLAAMPMCRSATE